MRARGLKHGLTGIDNSTRLTAGRCEAVKSPFLLRVHALASAIGSEMGTRTSSMHSIYKIYGRIFLSAEHQKGVNPWFVTFAHLGWESNPLQRAHEGRVRHARWSTDAFGGGGCSRGTD